MSTASEVVPITKPFDQKAAKRGETVEYQVDGIRWDAVHFVAMSGRIEGVAIIEYQMGDDGDSSYYVTGVPITELRMAAKKKTLRPV